MARFLFLVAIVCPLCLPLKSSAQYQTIELAGVQFAKSLSAVVQDPDGSPLADVLVQEFSSDWKSVLRTGATDKRGKFSLPTVHGRKIYYLQFSAPGFDPLRVRIRVDRKRGANLKLKLMIGT